MLAAALTHHDVDIHFKLKLNINIYINCDIYSPEDHNPVIADDFVRHSNDVLCDVRNRSLALIPDKTVVEVSVPSTIDIAIVNVHLCHLGLVTEADYHVVGHNFDPFLNSEFYIFTIVLPRTTVVTILSAAGWIRYGSITRSRWSR